MSDEVSAVKTGNEFNNTIELEFSSGVFMGVRFLLGAISFSEENPDGSINMKYEYEITDNNGMDIDAEEFRKATGDLIVQMIEVAAMNDNLVMTGGKDE